MTQAIEAPDLKLDSLEINVRQAHNLPTTSLILSTLLEISREIPDNANNVDSHMAEYLAGRFLKGMDLCGELYSLAVSYEMKMEIQKKKSFADAMLIRSVPLNIKTAKEKEMYAFSDSEYLKVANEHVAAHMFRLLIEEKKEAFYKAHYLMRKIVDKDVITTAFNESSDKESGKEWRRRSSWASNE